MMHPAGGMMPLPMGGMPPPMQQQQHPPTMPQQWGMVPPPVPPQQYQQPPPASVQAPMWNQQPSQIPPPLPHQMMQPHQYQQYAQAAPVQMSQQQTQQPPQQQMHGAPEEIRTLWIGDLPHWVEESHLNQLFAQTGEVNSVKIIRGKHTRVSEGYGFIEFITRAAADRVLQTCNGQVMPGLEQPIRLNWASAGERRIDDSPDFTIFVGDLAADVTDYTLQETFRAHYSSVKGAKVVTDRASGRSKGYGFVKFGDVIEQTRAMTEMNGIYCSSRPMRTGPATSKKLSGLPSTNTPPSFPVTQGGTLSENDPNNTTIFVGGLDPTVTDDQLRQLFSSYGELMHVKIPINKRCGFVQFVNRHCAEEALLMLQGTLLGSQGIRLSWGRSPSNKQQQQDQNQWNANYYGYGQGYEAYGYNQPAQDPNVYGAYGAYQSYGNYQQQQ